MPRQYEQTYLAGQGERLAYEREGLISLPSGPSDTTFFLLLDLTMPVPDSLRTLQDFE